MEGRVQLSDRLSVALLAAFQGVDPLHEIFLDSDESRICTKARMI